MSDKRVSRAISAIGKKAGVVVATVEKRMKKDGQMVTLSVKKFASAHDLRRSFGTRRAKRVMPAVLQKLMRHSAIETTLRYYADIDADDLADGLWREYPSTADELGLVSTEVG